MKELLVAVDPGFDSMKVVANGEVFKFPFNVLEVDERDSTKLFGKADEFMLLKRENGVAFRVGQTARTLLVDNKTNLDRFYSEQRFISEEFQVGLDTAIALAIEKNGLYDDLDELDIKILVTLPHSCVNDYETTIVGATARPHSFTLACGQNDAKKYTFIIKEENVAVLSQTISAILGETSDDKGNINEEKFELLNNGPTLVLDGGYYTMGMVVISTEGEIDERKTESDTNHAMRNVNQAVVESIKNEFPNFDHYMVETKVNSKKTIDKVLRYKKDGKMHEMDLTAIRKEKMQEVCADLIAYLDKKYNDLMEIHYVLVTGGTGACFYDQLLEYYSEVGVMNKETMLKTSSCLNGIEYSIEFAVAIGAYKGLKGMMQEA